MTKAELRKQILKEMKEQKITIAAMSRRIGWNHLTLYNFFAGRSTLGSDYLHAVIKELGGKVSF